MGYRYKKKLTLEAIENKIKECNSQILFHKKALKKYNMEYDEIRHLSPSEIEFIRGSVLKLESAWESYVKTGGTNYGPEPIIKIIGIFASIAEKHNGEYYNKNQLHAYLFWQNIKSTLSKNEVYVRYNNGLHLIKCINDTVDSIKFWEATILEYEAKTLPLRKKKDSLLELKARAAANAQETRIVAETVKRKLVRLKLCPYCDTPIESKYHVDHIHPVSKGGLSIPANMVHVCVQCNSRKGNLTLAAFIRKYGLDRDLIEQKLLKLHKDF